MVAGQHEPHDPPGVGRGVHVHDIPPLYVQVQVEPVQSACHVLPWPSWHDVVIVDAPPGPAPPVPEHAIVPVVGRGIAGHTVAGTHGSGGALDDGPASFRHESTACAWVSHPGKTVPIDVQTGCTDSVQLRSALTADAQGAVIAAIAAQCESHEGSGVDVGHAAAANLEQKVEQAVATWAGEQLLPHWARLPASPPGLVTDPPHARVDESTQATKTRTGK